MVPSPVPCLSNLSVCHGVLIIHKISSERRLQELEEESMVIQAMVMRYAQLTFQIPLITFGSLTITSMSSMPLNHNSLPISDGLKTNYPKDGQLFRLFSNKVSRTILTDTSSVTTIISSQFGDFTLTMTLETQPFTRMITSLWQVTTETMEPIISDMLEA